MSEALRPFNLAGSGVSNECQRVELEVKEPIPSLLSLTIQGLLPRGGHGPYPHRLPRLPRNYEHASTQFRVQAQRI